MLAQLALRITDNQKTRYGERSRSRSHRKRVLAVQAMAGETSWLDGKIVWHENRVVWETTHGIVMPGIGDIALAQRRLNQITRYPIASEHALGDTELWLQRRADLLGIAKKLRDAIPSDLEELVVSAQRLHNVEPAIIKRLAALILCEAICTNKLPASPVHALIAIGERAEYQVQVQLADNSNPVTARTLAALTLGGIHRSMALSVHNAIVTREGALESLLATEGNRRAYSWGLHHDIPREVPLSVLVRLLMDPDGVALARRYMQAITLSGELNLSSHQQMELLQNGCTATKLVALVAAFAEMAPLFERILLYRHELPDKPVVKRRGAAERLERERRESIAALAEILSRYACASADPCVLEALGRLAHYILDLIPTTQEVIAHLLLVLQKGFSLKGNLHFSYLDILYRERGRIWSRSCSPPKAEISIWLTHCIESHLEPVLVLLALADVDIVREALDLGVYQVLARYQWQEKERYRLVLTIARDLDLPSERHATESICHFVNKFPTAPAAHALVQPLLRALLPLPAVSARKMLIDAIYEVPNTRHGMKQTVPRLAYLLPVIVKHLKGDSSLLFISSQILESALQISSVIDDQEASAMWLNWLVTYLSERAATHDGGYNDLPVFTQWVELAATLAAHPVQSRSRDLACFQAIVRVCIEHGLESTWSRLEDGIKALRRFPQICLSLAANFPTQPHRCLKLLERMGLLLGLGVESLRPLDEFADIVSSEASEAQLDQPEWQELLRIAPEIAPVASQYVRAQCLLGESDALPAGVRQVLDRPKKWARELAHIQGILLLYPERTDLAKRSYNLRLRLANEAESAIRIHDEVVDALLHIADEAQLAAVEQQVVACYRSRLESLTGLFPEKISMSDDLLNATLILVGIRSNRKLLLRLVRGYLAGDSRWPEGHPANIAYIEKLRAKGVDTEAWLGAHVLDYPCRGVAGERVCLSLEQDPLHVLQMGNYFSTCLGFGGINAFSTVANACELNKRVIYARDGAGQVVGRKLIGISKEGTLVGFRTYISMGDGDGGTELKAIFARYASRFAESCGLKLADSGEVPSLFAEDWYDDGIIPWESEEKELEECSQTGTTVVTLTHKASLPQSYATYPMSLLQATETNHLKLYETPLRRQD